MYCCIKYYNTVWQLTLESSSSALRTQLNGTFDFPLGYKHVRGLFYSTSSIVRMRATLWVNIQGFVYIYCRIGCSNSAVISHWSQRFHYTIEEQRWVYHQNLYIRPSTKYSFKESLHVGRGSERQTVRRRFRGKFRRKFHKTNKQTSHCPSIRTPPRHTKQRTVRRRVNVQ